MILAWGTLQVLIITWRATSNYARPGVHGYEGSDQSSECLSGVESRYRWLRILHEDQPSRYSTRSNNVLASVLSVGLRPLVSIHQAMSPPIMAGLKLLTKNIPKIYKGWSRVLGLLGCWSACLLLAYDPYMVYSWSYTSRKHFRVRSRRCYIIKVVMKKWNLFKTNGYLKLNRHCTRLRAMFNVLGLLMPSGYVPD